MEDDRADPRSKRAKIDPEALKILLREGKSHVAIAEQLTVRFFASSLVVLHLGFRSLQVDLGIPVSRKTVFRLVRDHRLSPRLSDGKLFAKIDDLQQNNDSLPSVGGRMMASLLRRKGHEVSEARVREIQKELNPVQTD